MYDVYVCMTHMYICTISQYEKQCLHMKKQEQENEKNICIVAYGGLKLISVNTDLYCVYGNLVVELHQ